MPATILKSERAAQATIAIAEAFAGLRELARTVSELSEATEDFRQKPLMQKGGKIIADILCAAAVCTLFAAKISYSTVTDLARFRGWSTLQPRMTAMW